MNIRIRLFATYREQAGTDRLEVAVPEGATVAAAVRKLLEARPTLPSTFKPHLIAVNDLFGSMDHPLHDNDEVSLYPPVSGGVDVAVTTSVIDAREVADIVRRDSNGAVVTMEGATRNDTGGKRVLHLDYEADERMAKRVMEQVLEETAARFGVTELAARHRIGHLEIGEVSLIVAVGAPHRREAFFAAQHAVDRIKLVVPVWKREAFDDGTVWVGAACEHFHAPIDYEALLRDVAAAEAGHSLTPAHSGHEHRH